MIVMSIVAAVISLKVSRISIRRFGEWNSWLLAVGLFIVLVGVCAYVLPVINEVPEGFPADVLWRFRLSAWALQAVLWGAIGLLFGWFTERDKRWSGEMS